MDNYTSYLYTSKPPHFFPDVIKLPLDLEFASKESEASDMEKYYPATKTESASHFMAPYPPLNKVTGPGHVERVTYEILHNPLRKGYLID